MTSPDRITVGEVRANGCATIEAIASDSATIEVSTLLRAHLRYNNQIVLENHKIKLIRDYNVNTQRSGCSCSDYIYYKICQYIFFKLRLRRLETCLYNVLKGVRRAIAKMQVDFFRRL
jgi:hypothetical protein